MQQPSSSRRAGYLISNTVGGETVNSYIPLPLPPNPPVDLVPFQAQLEKTNHALGQLDIASRLLPSPDLFIYQYIRKEALLSSQIEGTQSSFSDLLHFEVDQTFAQGEDLHAIMEVSHYIQALKHGLARMQGGFPLCLRLLKEMHQILLASGRGAEKNPGEFRTSANWIGGTRPGNALFVPPPPHFVPDCMGALEQFLNDDHNPYPILAKIAFAHVQFETIHPFLDGNGRLGRLLISLLLWKENVLAEPVLYLSLYLKNNREAYYSLLQQVRTQGDWEHWLEFFLEGIFETAAQGVETTQRILRLFEQDQQKINRQLGATITMHKVHQLLKETPLVSLDQVCQRLQLTFPTATKAMNALAAMGIAKESTGKQRRRLFVYQHYLAILMEGTEPLAKEG